MNPDPAIGPTSTDERRTPCRRPAIIAAAVLILLLAGCEALLRFRLGGLVRRIVAERAGELGLKADVGHASATLAGARARFADISVGNPPGFTGTNCLYAGEVRLNADLLPLLWGTISLSSLSATNAVVEIERNERSELNMVALQAAMPTGQAPTTAKPPKLRIGRLRADAVVAYSDLSLPPGEPNAVSYAFCLTATNIRTTADNRPWAAFQINGHIKDRPGAAAADLRGSLAPLSDPAKPSFDIEGTISSIPLSEMPGLPARRKLGHYIVDARVRVSCRDGAFCAGSRVSLCLNRKADGGEGGTKASSLIPSSVTVDVPVRGTVKSPEFRIVDILSGTLLNNAARGIDSIARGIGNILGGGNRREQRDSNVETGPRP